ncbi:hypothetical protein CCR75_002805 [Bremia lactucae]|uniref:Uncharacterized protein n=1 Tax=Bremia lactucae TaxID=4779 RepID=A0A976FQG5_BRELC|nr:hypothetical protein CCR75_002805 [Bremia lactucae]
MLSIAFSPNSSSDVDTRRESVAFNLGPKRPALKKKKKVSKARALSTERSRQCRERQKFYSENLEAIVRALRADVYDLFALRDLRREQCLQFRGSVSGSLAKIVQEYMTMFRHGMYAPPPEDAKAWTKRPLLEVHQPTPDTQREFLNCIMDPYVEVFDWCGRFVLGASTLLNGWTAWAAWHNSLDFELVDIDVVDTEDTLAVTTKANLRVRISQETIKHLFPHILRNQQLCDRMIGQEVCYPIRDTFFFASNMRVIKYMCDVAFADALLPVAGDYETVVFLMSPPDHVPLNDLAVRTAPGDLAKNARLDVDFLLSDDDQAHVECE